MTDDRRDLATPKGASLVPWRRGVDENGDDAGREEYFQVRYKRRYLVPIIFLLGSFSWLGFSIFDGDMSEMFFGVAPFIFAPLLIRFPAFIIIPASIMSALILWFVTPPGLADLLGKLIVVAIFFIMFPMMALLWTFPLFDKRPLLRIGPEGIYCRQYSEDMIPWEDIIFIHVSTYERLRFLKVKNLIIGLQNFSCYPKPSGVWTLHYFIFRFSSLFKKPEDPASVHVSGMFLDPPLAFVVKAIKHYRPTPERPRRKRPQNKAAKTNSRGNPSKQA